MAVVAPAFVSDCQKKTLKPFLDVLTAADRNAAVARFKQRQGATAGTRHGAGCRGVPVDLTRPPTPVLPKPKILPILFPLDDIRDDSMSD